MLLGLGNSVLVGFQDSKILQKSQDPAFSWKLEMDLNITMEQNLISTSQNLTKSSGDLNFFFFQKMDKGFWGN